MPHDTIIVIPCYNEERRLDAAELCKFVSAQERTSLLLVDDGSTDGTLRLLELLAAEHPDKMRTLALDKNRGKAEAVRQGVLCALESAPDYVGYWDADLSAPLSEVDRLRRVFEHSPQVDLVLGSRVKMMGRTIERRAVRHYIGRVFATFASLTLRLPVYDTQCGAKLIRRTNDTRELFATPFIGRWVFDVELLARIIGLRASSSRPGPLDAIYEQPLDVWCNAEGSKVKPTDFLRGAIELARIRWRYGREIKAPRTERTQLATGSAAAPDVKQKDEEPAGSTRS